MREASESTERVSRCLSVTHPLPADMNDTHTATTMRSAVAPRSAALGGSLRCSHGRSEWISGGRERKRFIDSTKASVSGVMRFRCAY